MYNYIERNNMNNIILMMGSPVTKNFWYMWWLAQHTKDSVLLSSLSNCPALTEDTYEYYLEKFASKVNHILQGEKNKNIFIYGMFLTPAERYYLFDNIDEEYTKYGIWVEDEYQKTIAEASVDTSLYKELFRYRVSPKESENFKDLIYVSNDVDCANSTFEPKIRHATEILQELSDKLNGEEK